MNSILLTLFLSLSCFYHHGNISNQSKAPLPEIRTGKHNLTLQWIGWDNPGKVNIQKLPGGKYNIKGGQFSANKEEFVRIEGTLKVSTKNELLFTGLIESKANGINAGEVCERKGTYHFKSTNNRKYWRLQEMTNCEGGMVTDYIDIYFN